MTNLPIEYYIEEEHLKPIKPTIDMALKDGSLEMTVLSLESQFKYFSWGIISCTASFTRNLYSSE